MNLHPILVHFPIALFSLYALLELIRFKKVTAQPYWFYVKAIVVICAALGAGAAFLAGDSAREGVWNGTVNIMANDPARIMNLHERWADASVIILTLLAAAYLCVWLNKYNVIERLPGDLLRSIWRAGTALSRFLIQTPMVFVLAIAGLIAVTVTGALGGSIIYGPSSDPVVQAVYALLVR